MLNLNSQLRIFVYTKAADMRKGIDGLSGIIRSEFHADPTDGSLFVFVNRQRDRMKLIHFEGGGFWLYYRVLEAGTFEALQVDLAINSHMIDATQLTMWLSGISLVAAQKRRKRFVLPREKIVA
jgi:hypothetical protein